MMSEGTFVMVLALGAALLAIWTHTRFPKLAPASIGRSVLHTVLAVLALRLLPLVLESRIDIRLTIIAVALPAFSYAMLSAIWMLRLAQSPMGMQR